MPRHLWQHLLHVQYGHGLLALKDYVHAPVPSSNLPLALVWGGGFWMFLSMCRHMLRNRSNMGPEVIPLTQRHFYFYQSIYLDAVTPVVCFIWTKPNAKNKTKQKSTLFNFGSLTHHTGLLWSESLDGVVKLAKMRQCKSGDNIHITHWLDVSSNLHVGKCQWKSRR